MQKYTETDAETITADVMDMDGYAYVYFHHRIMYIYRGKIAYSHQNCHKLQILGSEGWKQPKMKLLFQVLLLLLVVALASAGAKEPHGTKDKHHPKPYPWPQKSMTKDESKSEEHKPLKAHRPPYVSTPAPYVSTPAPYVSTPAPYVTTHQPY